MILEATEVTLSRPRPRIRIYGWVSKLSDEIERVTPFMLKPFFSYLSG